MFLNKCDTEEGGQRDEGRGEGGGAITGWLFSQEEFFLLVQWQH